MNPSRPIALHAAVALVLTASSVAAVRADDTVQAAGDALQYALPAAAAVFTGIHRDGEGALQLGESAALTLGVTYALKYSINERRPNGGSRSMPSGHTSISFAAAEFMRKRYGWEYGVPAYAAASFVAYSRVESRQHHTKDVVAGAAIGIASSYLFTRPWKGWEVHADIAPTEGYYGLSANRSF